MKKTLSIFLSIVLAMTSCVFAISANADDSKYTFDKSTKTITITGVSAVSLKLFDDFDEVYGTDVYQDVESICLEKDVQTVEKKAFENFSNLKNLIVYNPYCSLASDGFLASVNRVAIYTFDVSGSTVKDYAEKRNDIIDSKSIYSITFTVNGKSTTVNALEGETAEELAAKAPEFPFEAYHNTKTDVDTYYKWSPELTDVSANATYKAVLSSKVACRHIEKVVKEATCQEEGLAQVICAVTGDVLGENVISKIPHNFDNNAEYCAYGCGTKNPNYKAPVKPSQPADPSTAQAASPTTSTTEAAAPTANAKKVDGVWVDSKLKKASVSKLKKGKKSITATWKKVSKIKGYQIQVATDKKFKKNKKTVTVSKQKTTKTTIKKLKANKKYYVRIRTYKNAKYNGKTVKVYSSWSKVKTVKTK